MADDALDLSSLDPADRERLLAPAPDAPPAVLDRLRRLRDTPPGPATPDPEATPPPGPPAGPADGGAALVAGRYRLVEAVGEGGMGTVWLAEQTEPVRRRVAVKLVRGGGRPAAALLERFGLERQAIALMDHPNIARLIDAGEIPPASPADEARPFFVMEFVEGRPLTEACDAAKLPLAERLRLFVRVCQAVQHAHQKGVIHRDLKPTNILVESIDGQPVPKVIDFGLAKAAGEVKLTAETVHTAFGTLAGTPEYMAPEQADLDGIDIDTRADVYALGVILFELLTGSTPVRREAIARQGLEATLRAVREEDAPAPSARVESSPAKAEVAAARSADPARLARSLTGDLDWIALKALAKERDRRYESAAELARDVERHLNHEPVLAGPPGLSYRLRKLARRNRPQVVAAGLVLAALVAGVIGTAAGLVRAEQRRRDAEDARQREAERADAQERERVRAEGAEATATANAARAEAERRVAQAVQWFLQSKLLHQADPQTQANSLVLAGRSASDLVFNPRVLDLLDRAAVELAPDRIEASFPGQPDVQAALLGTVGQAYYAVGGYGPAAAHLERALAMDAARLGADHPESLVTRHNLAIALLATDRAREAVPMLRDVHRAREAAFGPRHPETLTARRHLALALAETGKLDEAIGLYEQVRDAQLAAGGPDDPQALTTQHQLGQAYRLRRRPSDAIRVFEQVLERRERVLGFDHPDTHGTRAELGLAHRAAGNYQKAIALYDVVLKFAEEKVGPDHPWTLTVQNNLGTAYNRVGRVDEAIALLRAVHGRRVRLLGPGHENTLATANNLAMAYLTRGDAPGAIRLLEQTAPEVTRQFGPDHPNTAATLQNLAVAYRRTEDFPRAARLFEQVRAAREATLGPDHPETVMALQELGVARLRAGQAEAGVADLERVVAARRKQMPADGPPFADLLAARGHDLLRAGQYAAAETFLRECVAIRRKHAPDAWHTASAEAMLGAALLGGKKYAEAEPLLVRGYEGMRRQAASLPPEARVRYVEAALRLEEFYDATGNPAEAKKWRAARPPEAGPPPRVADK